MRLYAWTDDPTDSVLTYELLQEGLHIHNLVPLPVLQLLEYQFYPFKPNGSSHPYQMDKSISVLRVVGAIFHFIQVLI